MIHGYVTKRRMPGPKTMEKNFPLGLLSEKQFNLSVVKQTHEGILPKLKLLSGRDEFVNLFVGKGLFKLHGLLLIW